MEGRFGFSFLFRGKGHVNSCPLRTSCDIRLPIIGPRHSHPYVSCPALCCPVLSAHKSSTRIFLGVCVLLSGFHASGRSSMTPNTRCWRTRIQYENRKTELCLQLFEFRCLAHKSAYLGSWIHPQPLE